MKKRISAVLLSVVLCLAMLSTTALGADNSVSIRAKAGQTRATVTATGLQAKTEYKLCAVSRGGEILALFNATTNDDGNFEVSVDVGAVSQDETLKVSIPAAAGDSGPTTGADTVEPGSPTSYTITASAGEGGSISPSGSVTVTAGSSRTFTITPNANYAINDVKVDNESKGKISSYTFTDVHDYHTISATFTYTGGGNGGTSGTTVKPVTPGSGFSDVPSGAYYHDAVRWAVDQGITEGTTAATFSPNSPCTRAQIVTFLWRAAGSPVVGGANPFQDVPAGSYYYDAVLWAVANGITTGTSATTFSPNAPCTRAQAVTFLYRANGSPAVSGASVFSDVPSDAFCFAAVQWAVEKGVTAGTSAGLFSPNAVCTRAQIVTFLYRSSL